MATYTYLHNTLSEPHVLTAAINPDCPTGLTWQDYLAGKWILLSSAQLSFLSANPTANPKEIIEMQLTPPPPEPTLQEYKGMALSQVENRATGRLEEMYPAHKIMAAVSGFMDETAVAALILNYESAQSAILSALETVQTAINAAANKATVDTLVSNYNAIINAL